MSFPYGQYVSLGEGTGEISILENISIDRIGIQAKPGTEIKINNISMRVGRTGLFELETPISSIKIDSSKQYIIDYHIKEE